MPITFKRLLAVVLFLCGFAADPCSAQVCGATSTTVAFGNYSFSGNLDTSGTITVTCTSLTTVHVSYTIALSSGAGTIAARHFASLTPYLSYQLYLDAPRTQIWGDGTSGSSVDSDSFNVTGGTPSIHNYTIYARVPASQFVTAGLYGDLIVATITY